MRKQVKSKNSKILCDGLSYKNKGDNSLISNILFEEQKGFCAYTEEYLGRADAMDIEHFNPTLKGNEDDAYENWFLVKHQWNSEKSTKWKQFQPLIYPTDDNFEARVIYDNGDYRAKNNSDIEAQNLISLLKLDDPILADERKKYINRKRSEIQAFGEREGEFFSHLIEDNLTQIRYLRAIKEEFGVDIWPLIPNITINNHREE